LEERIIPRCSTIIRPKRANLKDESPLQKWRQNGLEAIIALMHQCQYPYKNYDSNFALKKKKRKKKINKKSNKILKK